jgi:hypothetical protein
MIQKTLIDSLPRFSFKRPSTNKLVYFRPILVKEEKKLLMCQELGTRNDIISGITEVLSSCYYDINIETLPTYEFDYFYVQLRSKSIGEIIDAKFICPETNEKINLNLNLNDIKITGLEKYSNRVKISDDLIFEFKPPSYSDIEDFEKKDFSYDDMIKLTARCLTNIHKKDESIDANSYTEEDKINSIMLLTQKQFGKIIDYFDNLPKYEYEIAYTTSDNIERKIVLSGIDDFFTLASVI